MATLASLKLVAAKKPSQKSPAAHRRSKLSSKILEQIQLARAHSTGQSYSPTRTKMATNAEGERVAVTVPKRIKPWWFTDTNGKVCVAIRYGAKIIELAKGKSAIEVASSEALIEALETVNSAVLAGELDAQLEGASVKLRDGFTK
jgi:hypothetical protein